ncbi:MAG TPA: amylo-alpha-1,6-glucosidase [Casimicrobiaceae bacterium]|nr:amylo-alpha-1,6-glucosidase [Casimicrobiaceae bacterium]
MTAAPAAPEAPARPAIAFFALKAGAQFLVADERGDIEGGSDGLFRDDTRVLSRLRLRVGSATPALLSSGLSQDNVYFRAHLTNRPLPLLGGSVTPEGIIHIERSRFLHETRLHERIVLTNYGSAEVHVPLAIEFAADFVDIFEVRGHRRPARGRTLPPRFEANRVALSYEGRDGVPRSTVLAFSTAPSRLDHEGAQFSLVLAARERRELHLEVGPDVASTPSAQGFRHAAACARIAMRRKRHRGAWLGAPRGPFKAWMDKARADLALLTTELETGPYPFAGIPWFSTPFGRDGIITSLQLLWLDPSLARGALRFLAAMQAHATVPEQDAEPGKILHEVRRGEMAGLGEVPFGRYYGGVDSTPLFLMLAGAYARRTGDDALVDALWPNLVAALQWIDGRCERNGLGLLDYERARSSGLRNQGWKDSEDSVFHADGRMPDGPVALVEVQGYVHAARVAMAELAERRGEHDLAAQCRDRAERIRGLVEARYWMPEHGFYAIAVDGRGEPCRVLASNAGHLLYTRLPRPERAASVVDTLLSARFNDGWGVRTLAEGEPRYNPMSYHNGSVWPHDTALCAAGIAAYGGREAAARLLGELFAAATGFGHRLPELFCGFGRRSGEPPVGYPVACLPQAWSSGAAFMVLQACLGITVDAWTRTIHVERPALPEAVDRIVVRDLEVAGARVSLAFQRVDGRVVVAPLGRVPDAVQVLVRA